MKDLMFQGKGRFKWHLGFLSLIFLTPKGPLQFCHKAA